MTCCTAIPRPTNNDTMLCRVLVKTSNESDNSPTFLKPREVSDISNSTRKSWVEGINRYVENNTDHDHIQPLGFLLSLDGSVEPQPSSDDETPLFSSPTNTDYYPAPYRIPPSTIPDLDSEKKFAVPSSLPSEASSMKSTPTKHPLRARNSATARSRHGTPVRSSQTSLICRNGPSSFPAGALNSPESYVRL